MFDLFLYKLDTDEVLLETDAVLENSLLKVRNQSLCTKLNSYQSKPSTGAFTQNEKDLVVKSAHHHFRLQVLNIYKLRRSVSIAPSTYCACVSFDPSVVGLISAPDPRISELGIKSVHGEISAPLHLYSRSQRNQHVVSRHLMIFRSCMRSGYTHLHAFINKLRFLA